MIFGLYHSAAGMMVNDYRQGVLANNIANADTVGFKRDIAVFSERIPAWRAGEREGPSARDMESLSGGLWLGRTHTDYAEGSLTQTGNPLDVALDGPGFLVVGVEGQPLLTRDGRMMTQPDGQLVSAIDGAPVLGRGGMPIYLDPNGSRDDIAIDDEGRIFQDKRLVGQLELVDVEDYGTLTKVGQSRFIGPDDQGIRAGARVRSGYVEASSTRPLKELVSLIEASRAYQMNAQMIRLQDQSLTQLISTTLRA